MQTEVKMILIDLIMIQYDYFIPCTPKGKIHINRLFHMPESPQHLFSIIGLQRVAEDKTDGMIEYPQNQYMMFFDLTAKMRNK